MEVKMQTSFIPKKPIVESSPQGSSISLFLLLSIIIFIVSASLATFVFLWQNSLNNKILADKKALEDTKKSYTDNPEGVTIEDLIRTNDRIEQAKILLAKHIAVTPVFILLEQNTNRNVQFKTMKFSYADANNIKIDLSGVAKNYDALSRQSDAFGSPDLRDVISQPVVSNFTLNPDGTVSFDFNALVNTKLVSYGNIVGAQTSSPNINTNTNTSDLINPL